MKQLPFVSVVVLNYNGKRYLETCLTAVFNQTYPKKNFEVIVVDNHSDDSSTSFLSKKFPQVRIVKNKENVGFAGGNNSGVEQALGEYIAFLNNDTKVDSNWLSELVLEMRADPKTAAVNSKLLLYHPFIEITIHSDVFARSEFTDTYNVETVGVLVQAVELKNQSLQSRVHFRSGFYQEEHGLVSMRWSKGMGKILIPCDPDSKTQEFVITVHSKKSPSNLLTALEITEGDTVLAKDVLKPHSVAQFELKLQTSEITDSFLYSVQNAGSFLFKNGGSRDRGAAVAGYYQVYEIDSEFFNRPCVVKAFCGASVLIKKSVFTKLGGFDERLFMYYEDTDLSLRMQRAGYRIRYCPTSVVKHIHTGSSGLWSPFFLYHTEKNYLAILLIHYPWIIITKNIITLIFSLLILLLKVIKWRLLEHWELYDEMSRKFRLRGSVLRWVFQNTIYCLRKRMSLAKGEVLSLKKLHASFT